MVVVALAVSLVLVGLLIAYIVMQEHTIRLLERTVKTYVATERRQAQTVRVLREELVHLSHAAQVLTLWRSRNVSVS